MNKLDKIYLKEIAVSQTGPFGSQLHEKDYVTDGTPIVTVEHLGETSFILNNLPMVSDTDKNRLSKYLLKEGDIVFSRVGSIDRCTYVTNKESGWLFSGRCLRVRFNSKANSKFMSFYFRQKYFKEMMLNISVGATMPSLNTTLMDNILLFLPNLEEQNKIAAVLSSLDSKIEINKKINIELEAIAKTIYNYWFVQFDFPNAKGKPYKSSGGKMVWNEELKREIPFGWDIVKICDWIAEDKNGDWGSDTAKGNYIRRVNCIRGADINGLNGLEECNPPLRFILDKNVHKILDANDIVIEISGGSPTQSTGRLAYITEATLNRFNNPLICSNFCKAISLTNPKLLYNFVYYWNTLYDNGVFFGYEGKTSGIKNLLFDSFVKSNFITIPDENIVDKFYDIISKINAQTQSLLKQNEELASLRDWLLPMLMNGQAKIAATQGDQLSIAAEEDIEYGLGLNIPNNKKTFAKQVLGGKIVSLYKDDPHFTQIKFQKLQFLAEHVIQADLNLNYYFQAAGPYDNRFMHTINDSLKKSKWFDYKNHKYAPLDKQSQINEYYNGYFKPVTNKLERLFSLLQNATEAEAEIIATIYAVWNNRLIQSLTISDDLLIADFYKWSKRKQQYTQEQILTGLNWLRTNNFEPTGFGKLIKQAKK